MMKFRVFILQPATAQPQHSEEGKQPGRSATVNGC